MEAAGEHPGQSHLIQPEMLRQRALGHRAYIQRRGQIAVLESWLDDRPGQVATTRPPLTAPPKANAAAFARMAPAPRAGWKS